MPTVRRQREEYDMELTDNDVIKVRFDRVGKAVVDFAVQYLAFIQERWHPIVRMDTAHDKAHQDTLYPDGTKVTTDLPTQDYNKAFTWSLEQIKKRWPFFRQRYERQMK